MIYTVEAFSKKISETPLHHLLGIDYGKKTLGLALSTIKTGVATPLKTHFRKTLKKDLHALKSLQSHHLFEGAVIGLPLNMDTTEGPMAQAAKQFGLYFSQHFQMPVCFWDERLTTFEATHALNSQKIRSKKQTQLIDQYAAQVILQSFVDHLNIQKGT